MNLHDIDEQQLRDALDQLDRLTHQEPPSSKWFASFVTEQLAEQKRKFRRDLISFLSVAPIAILLTMGTLAYGIGAVLIAQPIVLGLISLPVVLRRRKKVDG